MGNRGQRGRTRGDYLEGQINFHHEKDPCRLVGVRTTGGFEAKGEELMILANWIGQAKTRYIYVGSKIMEGGRVPSFETSDVHPNQ